MNTNAGKIPKPPKNGTLAEKATFEILTFISIVACLAFFCYSLIMAKDILDHYRTIRTDCNNERTSENKKIQTLTIKVLTLLPITTFIILMNYALWKIVITPELSTAHSKRTRSLVGPVTIHPIIPFPQDHLPRFKYTKQNKNMVPEAKIHLDCKLAEERNEFITDPAFISVIDEMNCWMRWIFDLDRKGKFDTIVPNNTRTISIKMDGFKHGSKSHDFEPLCGRASGSYFTYQMFGENKIQVTNYVANGASYVAGFCIYIENPLDSALGYDSEVIENIMKSEKYPGRSGSKEVATQTDPVGDLGENSEEKDSEDSLDSLEVGNFETPETNMETDEDPCHVEEPEAPEDSETSSNTENQHEETETNPAILPDDDPETNAERSQEPKSAYSEEAQEDTNIVADNQETRTNPEELSDEEDFDMLKDLKEEGDSWTGYCSKLQAEVRCGYFSGKVIHRQWNQLEKRMGIAECSVCLEDYEK